MYSAANVDMTTDESFGPRRFHNFGTAAAYFFANDILGVSVDGPIAAHRLVVEPRLGDLTSASGTVVTEYGLVPVSWSLDPVIGLAFSMVVPAGTSATVLLPANVPTPASSTLTVNGTSQAFTVQGRHVRFDVGAGALVAHLH